MAWGGEGVETTDSPCFEVDLIWIKLKSPDGTDVALSEGSE